MSNLEDQKFDQEKHNLLLTILKDNAYSDRYMSFCESAIAPVFYEGPPLDLRAAVNIFRNLEVDVHLDRRFKVLTFGRQIRAGWEWQGKLVVQRQSVLEPMFEGETSNMAVGSTMLALAVGAGDLADPPIPRSRFLPPHQNRPRFDGDMRNMERMVIELVALTRWMCDRIAETWDAPPTDGPA